MFISFRSHAPLARSVGRTVLAAAAASFLGGAAAVAQPLALTSTEHHSSRIFREVMPSERAMPHYERSAPADVQGYEMPAHLRRQVVSFNGRQAPGTIVIDTANTYLYLVLGNGQAMRYGIGVGREGFTWTGTQNIARKAEWPDWHPPADMLRRQPYLPRFMAGGEGNPLGARAMYLGNSLYRIHGTNAPETIGQKVSSGCIRMLNADVIDLYNRVNVGTRVVVLPDGPRTAPAAVAERRPVSSEELYDRRSAYNSRSSYEYRGWRTGG